MLCEGCPYITETKPIMECYCDKLGHKILYTGCCEEEETVPMEYAKGVRKDCAYERDRKHKKKLVRLAKICSKWYHSPAYMMDKDRDYTSDPEEMMFVSRIYRGHRSKYLKRISNKKIRRYNKEIKSRGGYKRIFDYWWEMY